MPELAQVTFKLNFVERAQIFVKQKNWENFKAIFVGRTVTTADPVIKLLTQKSGADSQTVSDPSKNKKALLERKAVSFESGLYAPLPQSDKTHWKDNRPEGAKPLGGRHGLQQADQAVKLVQLGKLGALDTLLTKLSHESEEGEQEYNRIRDHLLECGLMYSSRDASGKKHKGAEAVFRKHSQRFDGDSPGSSKSWQPHQNPT